MNERKVFGYCSRKRILLFAVPVAVALLYRLDSLKLEVFQAKVGVWYLMSWYDVVFVVLALCLFPLYLIVLNEMSSRVEIDSNGIRKWTLTKERSLRWNEIFEYRDLLYRIVLLPVKKGKSICIDYYMNLSKADEFNTDLIRLCKKSEVNMLVKPMTRRLAWGIRNLNIVFGLMVFCGLSVIIFPVDFVFPGMMSGICYVFLVLVLTFAQRGIDSEYSSFWILNHALNIVFFFVPLVLLLWVVSSEGLTYLVLGVISYLAGFLSMIGIMEMLLLERSDAQIARRLVAEVR